MNQHLRQCTECKKTGPAWQMTFLPSTGRPHHARGYGCKDQYPIHAKRIKASKWR